MVAKNIEVYVKQGTIVGSVVLVMILLTSFASAFAVGIPGDISLYPGQTFDATFDVMNYGGDIVVQGEITQGSEIVSFTKGSRFSVTGGSVVGVPVRYQIPANTPLGTTYDVGVIFRTVSAGEGSGSISFAEDVARSFKVVVGEKPAGIVPQPQTQSQTEERPSGNAVLLWTVIVILAVVLIVWFAWKKKNSN